MKHLAVGLRRAVQCRENGHGTIGFGRAEIHGPWHGCLVVRRQAAVFVPLAVFRERRETSLPDVLPESETSARSPGRGVIGFSILSGRMLREPPKRPPTSVADLDLGGALGEANAANITYRPGVASVGASVAGSGQFPS